LADDPASTTAGRAGFLRAAEAAAEGARLALRSAIRVKLVCGNFISHQSVL